MTLQKRIATAIATGAVLLNMAAPAFAATEIVISGNDRGSDNDIVANVSQNTSVNQSNNANFNNTVNASADTGGNRANDNDGEMVEVESGNATVNTTIVNEANKNIAEVNCCPSGDTRIEISDNDRKSNNTINYDQDQNVTVDQDNNANFDNDVYADADTGGNEANDNEGDGSVRVSSGNASVITTVVNRANYNSAVVGGDDEGGNITVRIADNDRKSDNDITLDLDSDVRVDQDNNANFDNYVDADADTGWNEANDNGATNVEVESGNATADTFVANHANFNHADVDCGCLFEDGLKVAVVDNGRYSDNNINADLDFDQDVDQDNNANFDNDVDADADTGWNEANDNEGEGEDSDPSVTSGNAKDVSDIFNHANLNALGDDLPDFDFSFDWEDLVEWLF